MRQPDTGGAGGVLWAVRSRASCVGDAVAPVYEVAEGPAGDDADHYDNQHAVHQGAKANAEKEPGREAHGHDAGRFDVASLAFGVFFRSGSQGLIPPLQVRCPD